MERRRTVGFMVFEYVENEPLEQALRLDESAGKPPGGILDWCGKEHSKPFLFATRQDARAAIDRTEHYRLAFGKPDMWPSKKACKIVPVEMSR